MPRAKDVLPDDSPLDWNAGDAGLPDSWRDPSPEGEGLSVTEFPSVLLVGAATLIQRHVTRPALEPHGLGLPEWRLVAFLAVHGRSAAGEMNSRMWMDKAQISRVLEGLIARGLVRREADPGHRQRQLVELTPRGKRLYAQALAVTRRLQSELLLALTPLEREGLYSALHKLRRLAERAAPAAPASARARRSA